MMARGKKEDFNFRDFDTGLVLIIDDKAVSVAAREFEYVVGNNATLTYGYIDHHAKMDIVACPFWS